MASQLHQLKDQKRPDSSSSDLQRRLVGLENQKDRADEKLLAYKHEHEKRDALVEKLAAQVRELTSHVDKAETEKRKYIGELDEATKRLRDATRNAEELKIMLRERDDDLKDSDEKRQDLKARAVDAIKE